MAIAHYQFKRKVQLARERNKTFITSLVVLLSPTVFLEKIKC